MEGEELYWLNDITLLWGAYKDMAYEGLKTGWYTYKAHLPAMLISKYMRARSGGDCWKHSSQGYGKTAGCNKAWNNRTANKKELDMDKQDFLIKEGNAIDAGYK